MQDNRWENQERASWETEELREEIKARLYSNDMLCRNTTEARKQAQANANYFGEPYVVFRDTSDNLRVEKQRLGPNQRIIFETYYPENNEYPET